MVKIYILLLAIFNFVLIKCIIPSLSVNKIDRKLIARKRQDTLDMCRIFTQENEKLKQMNSDFATNRLNHDKHTKRRVKRSLEEVKFSNPSLNAEDAKRVEGIVDKLYDDLQENGEPVTYRHKKLDSLTTATVRDIRNKTSRRHNFAPAELLGPIDDEQRGMKDSEPIPGIDWPKKWKHGIVPYFIDSRTYDSQLARTIMSAFDYFEKATCIRLQRLRERPTDRESLQNVEWLYITNPSGIRQCVHSNERKKNKGVQMIVFGYDCLSLGEIVHEIMHVLGFSHEHTRPDRDQHITIMWDNIKPGYKKYFGIRSDDPLLNLPYDYASILHYPPRAFSKNGQLTIVAEPNIKLGQREGLSETDVEKVGMIFGNECIERNRQYLLETCPSVVKSNTQIKSVSKEKIQRYFENRLWPFGVVNFKIRDTMEFSAEERENIDAVIRHIQKETCIEFRDLTQEDNEHADEVTPKSDTDDTEPDIKSSDTNEPKDAAIQKLSKANPGAPFQSPNILSTDDSVNEINPVNERRLSGTEDIRSSSSEIKYLRIKPKKPYRPLREGVKDGDVKVNISTKANVNVTQDATKRVRRAAESTNSTLPIRRHASSTLILARSAEPGCSCPKPGKPMGDQVIKINSDCFNSVNDLLHLFVHVLGLEHQHNMHDRDSYLHILWDKLTPEIKKDMEVKLPVEASAGFTYDYQSVMHYPWLQIKDGVTNIMYPIWNDGWAMGHWQGLSSTDVQKLNVLYYEQCQERKKYTEDNNNK